MNDLTGADLHSLRAAQGWAELGNYHEADEELENITASLRSHPDALQVRWHIHAHAKNWAACAVIAEALEKQAPSAPAMSSCVKPNLLRAYTRR